MNVGNKWIEKIDLFETNSEYNTSSLEIEGINTIGGKSYFRLCQKILKGDTVRSMWYTWLREESGGIVIGAFGSRSLLDSAKLIDPPLQMFPNNPTVGQTWDLNIPDMGGHFYYLCESVTYTVQAYAGTFNNCLRLKMYIKNSAGDTTQKSNLCYAKNIGEVLNEGWGVWSGNYKFTLYQYNVNVAVEVEPDGVPENFSLEQNYPNPFNPSTNFRIRIAESGFVKLSVYDPVGREVALLLNEKKEAGCYTVRWNASAHASGVYFYRLTTGKFRDIKRLVLIR
jgi:hypothetical protein